MKAPAEEKREDKGQQAHKEQIFLKKKRIRGKFFLFRVFPKRFKTCNITTVGRSTGNSIAPVRYSFD
jgi:hypothetical protein